MSTGVLSTDWQESQAALSALSDAERAALLSGISLEEYSRSSNKLPTAQRPRFAKDHALLSAPHGMSLGLQLLRDDGQLDDIERLALDRDESDRRGWRYQHQRTVTSLEPLAGLQRLHMLVADVHQALDLAALGTAPALTHLYLRTNRRFQVDAVPLLDLSPLAQLQNLEVLMIGATVQPMDLSPLAGMQKLRILCINNAARIRDLEPLREVATLEGIQLINTLRLSDLRPISAHLNRITPPNSIIEKRILTSQLDALLTAYCVPLDESETERLCTLRQAIAAGDAALLASHLVGAPQAILDLLRAGVTVKDGTFTVDCGWADLKRAGQSATTGLMLQLLRASGELGGLSELRLQPEDVLDHAILNEATGLQTLTLASGDTLTGEPLAAWLALPAGLRTDLQTLDVASVGRGLERLQEQAVDARMRALLLGRVPEMLASKDSYPLAGLDLRGQSMAGTTVRSQLTGADLRGMDLTGTRFIGVDLQGAQLQGATLDRAHFENCTLGGSDLTDASVVDVILDTRTVWPEGAAKPLVLPVAEIAEAHKQLNAAAQALSTLLRETGGNLPAPAWALIGELPTLAASWSNGAQLQRTLDSHALKRLMETLPLVFAGDDELEVSGCYDDETGYTVDRLTFGPVLFTSGGEFVFIQSVIMGIFDDHSHEEGRAAFHDLLGRLAGSADEWEDTPAEALFTAPASLDTEAMEAALAHVCEERQDPGDEAVGLSTDLEAFFGIIERLYARCAPMQKDSETLPLRWIQGRLF
jgi:hypothetical protein